MNRKQWIVGAVLLIVLTILCIAGSLLAWNRGKAKPGSVGHHETLPGFGYCSSRPMRPCILSFNLDQDGSMLINVLAKNSSQDFYIKIKEEEGERIYECKRDKEYSLHVSCRGDVMPVGETLSFLILSQEDNAVLAEGSFPIIGVALATPEVSISPTPFLHQGPR